MPAAEIFATRKQVELSHPPATGAAVQRQGTGEPIPPPAKIGPGSLKHNGISKIILFAVPSCPGIVQAHGQAIIPQEVKHEPKGSRFLLG